MAIRVLRAGAFTTVQDRGRRGWQRDGVPVGGAMDDVACRLANALVGNASDAAVLEATLRGPTLSFEREAYVAVTGADMDARIGGQRIATWWAAPVPAGGVLSLDTARAGCRSYIAVSGGFDVPSVLGSRSTHVRAGFGGAGGRALQRGDTLAVMQPPSDARGSSRGLDIRHLALDRDIVRMVEGPHLAHLEDDSRHALLGESSTDTVRNSTLSARITGESPNAPVGAPFMMEPESDRMGLRLNGPRLAFGTPPEPLSAGVTMGTVQLPPSGNPLVLMADRQTIGGYPRIGDVITADLPVLAQLRPGESVRFSLVSAVEAERLYLELEHELSRIERFL